MTRPAQSSTHARQAALSQRRELARQNAPDKALDPIRHEARVAEDLIDEARQLMHDTTERAQQAQERRNALQERRVALEERRRRRSVEQTSEKLNAIAGEWEAAAHSLCALASRDSLAARHVEQLLRELRCTGLVVGPSDNLPRLPRVGTPRYM